MSAFAETPEIKINSMFHYSNTMTLEVLDALKEHDARFDDAHEFDIVNLALVLLIGFAKPELHNKDIRDLYIKLFDDYDEFKTFAIYTMNQSRINNNECNKELINMLHEQGGL